MLERSGENLFRHGRRIYATGIVTDKLFQLLRTQQREVELIIRDFTRVFASPGSVLRFPAPGAPDQGGTPQPAAGRHGQSDGSVGAGARLPTVVRSDAGGVADTGLRRKENARIETNTAHTNRIEDLKVPSEEGSQRKVKRSDTAEGREINTRTRVKLHRITRKRMRLKEAIQHTSGLRCVVEGMEICSSVGRRMLHEMTWLGEESAITAEHDRITSVLRLLETEEGRDRTETIRRKLALLRDIRSTIERTAATAYSTTSSCSN